MKIKSIFSCCILFLLLTPGIMGTNSEQFDCFKNLRTLLSKEEPYSFDFKQLNRSLIDNSAIKAEGSLSIRSLTAFSWKYSSRPENEIVCDGSYVYMITPETEQVMVGKSSEVKTIWSPVTILASESFEQVYKIEELAVPSGKSFRLTPNKPHETLDYLILEFPDLPDVIPFRIKVFDTVGQVNELTFSKYRLLDPSYMVTVPDIPSNYDVTDFQGNPILLPESNRR